MLKSLQARIQQYVNHKFPDVQSGFRKGRGTRDQIANIHWIIEKAREFQKNTYFCFIDCTKVFDCVSLAGCSPWGRRVRQDLGTEQQQTQFPLQRLCLLKRPDSGVLGSGLHRINSGWEGEGPQLSSLQIKSPSKN